MSNPVRYYAMKFFFFDDAAMSLRFELKEKQKEHFFRRSFFRNLEERILPSTKLAPHIPSNLIIFFILYISVWQFSHTAHCLRAHNFFFLSRKIFLS